MRSYATRRIHRYPYYTAQDKVYLTSQQRGLDLIPSRPFAYTSTITQIRTLYQDQSKCPGAPIHQDTHVETGAESLKYLAIAHSAQTTTQSIASIQVIRSLPAIQSLPVTQSLQKSNIRHAPRDARND